MFVSYFTLCPLFIQFTAFTYLNTFSGLFTSRTGVKIKILLYDGSEQYADLAFAGQALIKGFLCFFPVILCSMIFALIGFVMGYFYGKFLKTGKKELYTEDISVPVPRAAGSFPGT